MVNRILRDKLTMSSSQENKKMTFFAAVNKLVYLSRIFTKIKVTLIY